MFNIEYDVIDEIVIGETQMRLVENIRSKKQYIQLWSSLSKQWNITYRTKVDDSWKWWKKYADVYSQRHQDR